MAQGTKKTAQAGLPIVAIASYPAVAGAVLASLRKERNLAQKDIAGAIGATVSTWSRIETGESALTIEQLKAAADKLKIKPSEILKTADEKVAVLADKGVETISGRSAFEEAIAKLGALPLVGASLGAALGGPIGAALGAAGAGALKAFRDLKKSETK